VVDRLTVRFDDVVALQDVSLRFARGALVSVIGPNGAGKTTLLRCLAGLLAPTAGGVRVLDMEPVRERVRLLRRAGFVPDNPTFHEHLTVREVFHFVSRVHGIGDDLERARWGALAPLLELDGVESSATGALSFGQRKRLGLACALVHGPEMLLLDEPLTGLDPRGIEAVRMHLRALVAKGCTVVLSTHLLDVAESADTIAWIENGALRAVGARKEMVGAREGELRRRFLAEAAR
jgi:ABC-2 type transport system ATP-binding protein